MVSRIIRREVHRHFPSKSAQVLSGETRFPRCHSRWGLRTPISDFRILWLHGHFLTTWVHILITLYWMYLGIYERIQEWQNLAAFQKSSIWISPHIHQTWTLQILVKKHALGISASIAPFRVVRVKNESFSSWPTNYRLLLVGGVGKGTFRNCGRGGL